MANRHLDARGKGEYFYDFDNLVIDFDKEDYMTGMRVFDASKIFKLTKLQLKSISQFEFNASCEDNVISIQLRFAFRLRNKQTVVQGQDFIREAIDANINNSEVQCTVG